MVFVASVAGKCLNSGCSGRLCLCGLDVGAKVWATPHTAPTLALVTRTEHCNAQGLSVLLSMTHLIKGQSSCSIDDLGASLWWLQCMVAVCACCGIERRQCMQV